MGAFVADESARAALQAVLTELAVGKSSAAVATGGLAAALAFCTRNATPDILIVDTDESEGALIARIDQLAEVCDAGTRLIVVGRSNDVALYRTLIRRGVADYLVGPICRAAIAETLRGLTESDIGQPLGRVFAFFGAKGGVGSSTIACNVAWTLAKSTAMDVVLADLDIAFGTVALAFNLEARQGVANALADRERLDDVLLARYLKRPDEHLSILASPASLESQSAIDPEALAAVRDKLRRTARYVLLDVPHVWAPWTREALAGADEVVVTATADLASLRNLKQLIEARRGEGRPIRYVLNQTGACRNFELSEKDFTDALGIAPLAVVPSDPALFGAAATDGRMLGEGGKTGRAVEAIRNFAHELSGHEPAKGGKSVLRRLLARKPELVS